jgi:hypothetical protein
MLIIMVIVLLYVHFTISNGNYTDLLIPIRKKENLLKAKSHTADYYICLL